MSFGPVPVRISERKSIPDAVRSDARPLFSAFDFRKRCHNEKIIRIMHAKSVIASRSSA